MSTTVEYVEDNDASDIDGCDISKDAQICTLEPLHAVSIWKEPEIMTRWITMAVLFPSGVDVGGFYLRVVDGGQLLDISVKWPHDPIDLNIMHKK